MTKEQIGKLLCTDQVRRGNVSGIVVQSTPTHVKIAWDEQGCVPTTYAKTTAALKDVRIEHQEARSVRAGLTFVMLTRPGIPTSQEENPYESD